MEQIDLKKIKTELSRLSCPVHHQKAEIIIKKDGFEIKACCERFHKQLQTKIETLSTEQIKAAALKSLGLKKR